MAIDQIHGHEIMAIVAGSPAGITVGDLAEKAAREYGAAARFFTCSAENMNLDELLAFLGGKDKLQIVDGRVVTGGAPACNHG